MPTVATTVRGAVAGACCAVAEGQARTRSRSAVVKVLASLVIVYLSVGPIPIRLPFGSDFGEPNLLAAAFRVKAGAHFQPVRDGSRRGSTGPAHWRWRTPRRAAGAGPDR